MDLQHTHSTIMKKTIIFILLLMISASTCIGQQKPVNPSGFEIHRGVNLSHWLSQNFGWSPKDSFITENDLRFIDSIGYDHVRIPVDEAEMWTDDGSPSEQSFTYLTRCLDWCAQYGLRAIVDLHILKSHHFNAGNEGKKITLWTDSIAQNNFIKLWMNISSRLREYPDTMVAYELMNEAVADDHEEWNTLIAKSVSAIRQVEPNRVLVIGSNRWQRPEYFPFLKIPKGDKNIILSFHTYSPIHFTHNKAYWTSFKAYAGPAHYPGQVVTNADLQKYVNGTDEALMHAMSGCEEYFDKQRLADELTMAIRTAKTFDLQLYCGEFGCLPHVDRKDRLKYYEDIVSIFEENSIAWCNWEYKGDFGIYIFDFEKKISLLPDFGLINVLLHGKESR
jgi:endoglucanase